MKPYLEALDYVLKNGIDRLDRTGVGTRAVFGMQMRYQMEDGFPAMTTKKLAFESVKAELLWFLQGSSDLKVLRKLGSHIWDANAAAPDWQSKARFEGDAGRIYGVQWRDWRAPGGKKVDQLAQVIEKIKKHPSDRRLIVTAWNPGELEEMVLPPCHLLFQFFVAEKTLSLQMYQRSGDMFLGVPFNIASYSLLLHLVAQVTGLKPGEFIHILGDAHIYHNHFEQVKAQLKCQPWLRPKLWLNSRRQKIDDFQMEDIKLMDYRSHPAIQAPMAV